MILVFQWTLPFKVVAMEERTTLRPMSVVRKPSEPEILAARILRTIILYMIPAVYQRPITRRLMSVARIVLHNLEMTVAVQMVLTPPPKSAAG